MKIIAFADNFKIARADEHINEAAHAARTHTVLEILAYGSHVGGHFGEKKLHILFFCNKGNVYNIWCRKTNISFWQPFFGKKSRTYYSFVTKVMCTKFGAERSTSHFLQRRPLEIAGMLVAIWRK